MTGRTALLTAAALAGFAGNSLLCRLALAGERIDAATFTSVRLASGALVLAALAAPRRPWTGGFGRWRSALALFAYAVPFSFAYRTLGAGMGALLLFAAVQVTMIGWGLARGERPGPPVWAGLVLALGGLAALVAPGASAPDPLGGVGMAVAGIAWGVYSLRGRTSAEDPLVATAGNFARCLPLAAVLAVAGAWLGTRVSFAGVALAVASGALASGVGYALWYAALRGLTATQASVLQLLVPVLAAFGGVALLGEAPSWRLVLCGAAILGGVALAIAGRSAPR